MVVAPHKPYFYQADERDSANKWENLTRTPIRIVSTKHEQAVDPLGA